MDDVRITQNCKECNRPFSISKEEATWLKDKGLALFKRCSECRKKRREEKNGK